ncbi:MAG: hypothetical protein Q8K55_02475 [Gemmatimonadaceae bacterium]|nr:hypothetical protein [Gemmatimonadaceae bacterium]
MLVFVCHDSFSDADDPMTLSPQAPDRFALEKWYLDVVEPDGSASIAYWASLTWMGVDVTWHNVCRYALGAPPEERSSLRRVPPPSSVGGRIAWESKRLELETVHDAATPALSLTLLDDARGRVTWECVAPSARAHVVSDGVRSEGTGYAERISMTVRPWEMPLDELRWGRWMSDDASVSLVWIDWRGPSPRRWVVCNGALNDDASVGDDGVALGRGRLALGAPRTLHDRSVNKLLRGITGLARVAARIPIGWEEAKWCSRATWTNAAGEHVQGWAIHELVRFP